jgi:hypothetical protein
MLLRWCISTDLESRGRTWNPPGLRDLLVRTANAPRLAVLPHLGVVSVPSAHALNHSDPQLVAELIEAYIAGEPLVTQTGR